MPAPMTTPFARCLGADPYYFSMMDTIILPARFCERLAPALAVPYRQTFETLRAGDCPMALERLAHLEAAAGGADAGLCAATGALAHTLAGNPAGAAAALTRALAASPDCAEYHHLAGVLALRRRAVAAAMAHFQDAVRLDPTLGPAWAAMALLFTLDGQWAAVEPPARRALALGCELGAHLVAYGLLFSTLFEDRPVTSPFLLPPSGTIPAAAMERLLARLPAVTGSWPGAEPGPILFVACDGVYLIEHALALLWSLEETAGECAVHLHLFNPRADDLPRLAAVAAALRRVRISHTTETVDVLRFGSAAVYYSCARFCRLAQFVRATGRSALMLDADSLFRKPPDQLPGWGRTDLDLALFENPGAPPWEQILAWGVYAAATPQGLAFLDRVGFFVGQNLIARKGLWFLDQIALFLAHRSLSAGLRIQNWDSRCFDLGHGDQSLVWTVTRNKNQDSRYNDYKRALCQRHERGMAAVAPG